MQLKNMYCANCGKPLTTARAPHTLDKVVTPDSSGFCCPDCLFDGPCECPEEKSDAA